MKTKRLFSLITPIALTLAGTTLAAQVTTGQLSGAVTDGKARPLAGVKVILKSPQLMMQREVITGADGEWRAPLLPPGNYQIAFFKDGMLGRTLSNVRVGVGASLRQDIALKAIAAAEAIVEVVSQAEAVDKTETKTATNFSADLLEQLSGDRGFAGATDFTSGVATSPQGTPIIRGGTTAGNVYSVNGNDVKDPMWGQVGATWFLPDSVEDVQVVLSPLNARNGRTLGGTVNVVTKSGGNEFEGVLRWTPSRSNNWQARGHTWLDRGWQERSDAFSRQTNVNISGPVIKDRLWFAVGTYLIPQNSFIQNLDAEPDPRFRRPIRTGVAAIDAQTALNADLTSASKSGFAFPSFNYSQPYSATQKNTYYEAKLTLAITGDHRIAVNGSEEKSDCKPTWSVPWSLDQIQPTVYKNSQYGVSYNGVLGSSTFVDARFTHSSQKYADNSGSTLRDPNHTGISLYVDATDPAATGNSWYQLSNQNLSGMGLGSSNNRANTNLGVNLKMFRDAFEVGHDIDVGVDYYRSEFATTDMAGGLNEFVTVGGVLEGSDGSWVFPTIVWPGRGSFGTNADGTRGLAPTLYKYYGKDGTAKSPDLGLYVNDQITLNKHWNLMFGLRYDKVQCIDTTGATLISSTNWSPRFVATFDPRGDSTKVFKFTFSRLASDYPQQLTSRFYTTARATGEHLVWTGMAGQKAIPADGSVTAANVGDYLKWANMSQLLDVANYGNPTAFYDNTKAWQIDPDLKPMMCNEYTVEFKRAYANGSYTRMAYIYRKYSNMWATSRDYTSDYWQVLKDTSGATPPLQSKLIQQTRVFNSDALWRDYNGLELESYCKISPVFSARFSYTYSRLHGNDNSLDGASDQYYGDTAVTNMFQYSSFNNAPMSERSPNGALRNDAPHRVRATLQAVIPVGKGGWISYAAVGRYDSGANWDATAPATYGADLQAARDAVQAVANGDPQHIAPNAIAVPTTWTKYYAERGAYHWNDSFQMDLTITWEIPLVNKFKLIGALNIWNLFNHTLQTSYDATSDPNISSGTKSFLVDAGHFGGTRQDSFGNYNYWNSARSVTFNTGFKF